MSDDKAKDKKPQKLETFKDDIKTQEQLEDELGSGVEKIPKLPEKPEIKTIKLDLSGPRDIDAIVKEIDTLPDSALANKATEKFDSWQKTANKVWVIKQSEEDSFLINCRVGKKENGKWKWEITPDGRIKTEKKRFFYTPVTKSEKEVHLQLMQEKESANYDLIVEVEKINKVAKDPNVDAAAKYLEKKSWIDVSTEYGNKMHKYYYGLFQTYYNVPDEDMDRISLDDMMAYVDVALYKEGVRSPQ